MIYTARLERLPLSNRRTGDIWFLVRVTDEDGGDEVVFQSRPLDGRPYTAGSAELSDVLIAAIAAVVNDLEQRVPEARVVEAFETTEQPSAGIETLVTASPSFTVSIDPVELT